MADSPTIAYLTSVYARAADTFIRGEVAQLRHAGLTVHTFSIRRPPADEKVSDEIRSEQAGTDYVLDHGFGRLFLSTLVLALSRPGRMFGAIILAIRSAGPGWRAAGLQLVYLLEASYLARQLIATRVQHIHNHIPMNSATVCMLAAHLADITYSMTVHGPHVFYEPMRWALPIKIERSAFTVCITNFTRSQCMGFVSPDLWPKLQVVRCGVDAALLDQAPTPVPDTPRLVTVGRLSPEKGQTLLIEAVARLRAEGLPVELVIIGDGPARSDIEQMIERHKLNDCVTMRGWQSSDQISRQLTEARALVLASFAEGLPVVIMEALALYRPVIATQIAGVPELVADEVNGWLVPAGSVEALADAMRQALQCPVDRLAQMGRAGHEAVCRLHDRRKEVGKLEQLLREHI